MNNFTDREQRVIDRQGWNPDSLVSILAGFQPGTPGLDRLAYMRYVARTENGGIDWAIDDLEDVPALMTDNELIGKTIDDVEYVTVPGAFGEDNGVLLHFTDGTAHTFVQPSFEE